MAEEAVELSTGILGMHGVAAGDIERLWSPYVPDLVPCGTYQFWSMERMFGIRIGVRDWKIYRLQGAGADADARGYRRTSASHRPSRAAA